MGSTTFHLSRKHDNTLTVRWEHTTIMVEPAACPMFHELPERVQRLVDAGWRVDGHRDDL